MMFAGALIKIPPLFYSLCCTAHQRAGSLIRKPNTERVVRVMTSLESDATEAAMRCGGAFTG
jgi:hypothetical protein